MVILVVVTVIMLGILGILVYHIWFSPEHTSEDLTLGHVRLLSVPDGLQITSTSGKADLVITGKVLADASVQHDT